MLVRSVALVAAVILRYESISGKNTMFAIGTVLSFLVTDNPRLHVERINPSRGLQLGTWRGDVPGQKGGDDISK